MQRVHMLVGMNMRGRIQWAPCESSAIGDRLISGTSVLTIDSLGSCDPTMPSTTYRYIYIIHIAYIAYIAYMGCADRSTT